MVAVSSLTNAPGKCLSPLNIAQEASSTWASPLFVKKSTRLLYCTSSLHPNKRPTPFTFWSRSELFYISVRVHCVQFSEHFIFPLLILNTTQRSRLFKTSTMKCRMEIGLQLLMIRVRINFKDKRLEAFECAHCRTQILFSNFFVDSFDLLRQPI